MPPDPPTLPSALPITLASPATDGRDAHRPYRLPRTRPTPYTLDEFDLDASFGPAPSAAIDCFVALLACAVLWTVLAGALWWWATGGLP